MIGISATHVGNIDFPLHPYAFDKDDSYIPPENLFEAIFTTTDPEKQRHIAGEFAKAGINGVLAGLDMGALKNTPEIIEQRKREKAHTALHMLTEASKHNMEIIAEVLGKYRETLNSFFKDIDNQNLTQQQIIDSGVQAYMPAALEMEEQGMAASDIAQAVQTDMIDTYDRSFAEAQAVANKISENLEQNRQYTAAAVKGQNDTIAGHLSSFFTSASNPDAPPPNKAYFMENIEDMHGYRMLGIKTARQTAQDQIPHLQELGIAVTALKKSIETDLDSGRIAKADIKSERLEQLEAQLSEIRNEFTQQMQITKLQERFETLSYQHYQTVLADVPDDFAGVDIDFLKRAILSAPTELSVIAAELNEKTGNQGTDPFTQLAGLAETLPLEQHTEIAQFLSEVSTIKVSMNEAEQRQEYRESIQEPVSDFVAPFGNSDHMMGDQNILPGIGPKGPTRADYDRLILREGQKDLDALSPDSPSNEATIASDAARTNDSGKLTQRFAPHATGTQETQTPDPQTELATPADNNATRTL